MQKTLEKTIKNYQQGVFLLEAPTGFGKTTAVLNLIRDFLHDPEKYPNVKRICFVTNLITNLPYQELLNGVSEDEAAHCFQAKANCEHVIEKLLKTPISNNEVRNSKEYNDLYQAIESYFALKKDLHNSNSIGAKRSINYLYQRISTDCEPKFRRYLESQFFYNKSPNERQAFIRQNGWFRDLYPICDLEKYKVVFLTTKKFVLPIYTFLRMPFYAYIDSFTQDSVVFIDEFDSTKKVLLDQIVEDGIKDKVDIVSLFLKLHFSLQNLTIPKKLLNTSQYNKDKVERGVWYTTESHFSYWKNIFQEKYETYSINYIIKSVDFPNNKSFIFDDGKQFNIVRDNSKKYIYTKLNETEAFLSLINRNMVSEDTQINEVIHDLRYCIDGLTNALNKVANNYMHFKNEHLGGNSTKFALEEAIYTVLDVLNLSGEEKDYLFEKIKKEDYSFNNTEDHSDMRRGFNYTEIEDSNYHDAKSVVHNFNFSNTPEDILLKLAKQSLVIGISATANVPTCINNYDLKYMSHKLGDKYIAIDNEDQQRIKDEYLRMQALSNDKYKINIQTIDELNCFSDKEKCREIICSLFAGEYKDKYIGILEDVKIKHYYYLIDLKIAKLYNEMQRKDIYSFIAFLNTFPKFGGRLDLNLINNLINDIDKANNYQHIQVEIVDSTEFEEKFGDIKEALSNGEKRLVLTTYQTIGTGKNIQYRIPEALADRVILSSNDNYRMKDFEAVYLSTPTNLIQYLDYNSDDIYSDLAKYLFHQEYLYQNDCLTYYEMRINIINGFKRAFFSARNSISYTKNRDMNMHTLSIAIQAVGRICRCRNKNKNIYIFTDKEVLERIKIASLSFKPTIVNKEFEELLNHQIKESVGSNNIAKYSAQSKRAYVRICRNAWTVRSSYRSVKEWEELREFVLKNPTTNNPGKYSDYYFCFDTEYAGYSYRQDSKHNIISIKMDTNHSMGQVSEQACDLPLILSNDSIEKMFDENGYAKKFKKARFIMCPSLYQQIYLGALGEVVGKHILEEELGWSLENLQNYKDYELFDYQLKNVYFDFKHWNTYRVDNDTYVEKVNKKLRRVNGSKCFVINVVKRNDAPAKVNIDGNVIQIPYLIDNETGEVDKEMIRHIERFIC